jgi:NAD(P)-dependent dehydrogenase (short-subunit alcohol dehydrogenase family)
MGTLDNRVVIITGAGRGMGREHALLCASEGARVVVNDLGCERDGSGHDLAVAEAVVEEIIAAGGSAVANGDDVGTMSGAQSLVDQALETFGTVHVLINNAGILRDRMFVNMSEEDWDLVMKNHMKTVFCPTRIAASYWRDQSKAGQTMAASVISMSSTSGLLGAVGQSNYGAAKAGIAAFTVILAEELGRYGVRVNAITPVARTRMTEDTPGVADLVKAPEDPAAFDVFAPGNVSPFVAWLATEQCPATGQIFYVKGGDVRLYSGWHHEPLLETNARWTVENLVSAMAGTSLAPA